MARRYGRRRQGARLVAAVPHGHWKTTTSIAGLRASGVIAPLVLDGPLVGCGVPTAPHRTGPAFRAYVEQFLAAALKPGMSWRSTTSARTKSMACFRRARASILYLPPYSPDLNPIEQPFATLKALLRKAAARTRDGLWSTIGHLLAAIPPH